VAHFNEHDAGPSASQLRKWGLDPSWSRRVTFTGSDGAPLTWHVFDTGPGPLGTVVCVHGNPSWGYLWRDVLGTLAPGWRVIAVDQTGMGYSDRPGPRRLADRVDELVRFCRQEVNGPLVLAAHDWGGPVALGAAASLDVRAVVLANTAVAKPDDVKVPPLIALARRLTALTCERTPLFVGGAARMTAKVHRDALRAPYRGSARRRAIAEFVEDIPVRPGDPSAGALARSAGNFESLACPILLIWGGRDQVFHDRFLRDLRQRAPQASVERYADAGHFVCLDKPIGALIDSWLTRSLATETAAAVGDGASAAASDTAATFQSVLFQLAKRSNDDEFVYQGPDGTLTWRELDLRSTLAASALSNAGIEARSRISILIAPSPQLLIAVMAVWKVGGVAVVADASSGVATLRRLVRAAAPTHIIGTPVSLLIATMGRFSPGASRSAFVKMPRTVNLCSPGDRPFIAVVPGADDDAAIVHTSGATGPAKPVRYSHGALAAQRDTLSDLLRAHANEAFTTSFAPFMILAPVLGMGFVRPAFDVDAPSTLGFDELKAATDLAHVATAWLSPSAARTIVATSARRHVPLSLVLLAGAPVASSLVSDVQALTGGDVRAPYGMTECLPVTDGTSPLARGPLGGGSTGRPLPGCRVAVVALDDPRGDELADNSWGEILVSAPWMFTGYDAHWRVDAESTTRRDGERFHRTGDVGYVADGLLFLLGRLQHVIRTSSGPLASVALEEPVATELERVVAAVAVGPPDAAVVAIVVSDEGPLRLAPAATAARVRSVSPTTLAAVVLGRLPVDRRHESKIDRAALSLTVNAFLAGR